MKWRHTLLALAAGLGLAGMSAAPAVAQAAPPTIDWKPCGTAGAECGAVEAPLDWSRPQAGSIPIGVSRVPATDPAHRAGTLFWNPGGPGGSAYDGVGFFPTDVFTPALRARFDLVGVDPPGDDASRAVTCTVAPYDPTVPQFPRTRAELALLVAHNQATARSCQAATGPELAHVDTVTAARDLDLVRRALGVDRISWLGVSYGTMLGAEYADLFPAHVGRMVLDGAVDHSMSTDRLLDTEAAAVEDEFHRFVAWCDGDTACALHGRDVTGVWDSLMARAERRPLPAGADPPVTAEQMRYLAQAMFNGFPATGPILSQLVASAAAGDGGPIAGFVAQLPTAISPAYRAITCLDFSPQMPGGYPQLEARIAREKRIAPHMGGASEIWGVMAGCLGWPIAPVDPQRPYHVAGIPPALIVSNTHDDATPLAWGRSLHRRLGGSRLLVYDGDGHTAYQRSHCATSAEEAYLVAGRLPAPGTICGP